MAGGAAPRCLLNREGSSWRRKAASTGRARVPSPACRRQGDGSRAGSGAGPSAPSVSRCPTSIPQPLALIQSPPHAGQRQKQSRDNPSVPPAEPRPHAAPLWGIAPARTWGLWVFLPRRPHPTAPGASPTAAAPHSPRPLQAVVFGGAAALGATGAPSAVPWPVSHPREPRHSAGGAGTCRGSREMTEALSERLARLNRSRSQN